jgi:hypothetical protein
MEQLRVRAEWFGRHVRLKEEEVETIIEEMKKEVDDQGEGGQNNDATRLVEHQMVLEAMNKELLQVHRIAPNSKQDGMFRLMCKNTNGFNNMISGNSKIAKALDIKDDMGIDCLMYCKHPVNQQHKDNKNDIKQMFHWEIACTALTAHNTHEGNYAGQVQEGRTR